MPAHFEPRHVPRSTFKYCRVKGVQRLRMADASVMPRIPRSGGAHATVIMIDERIVDWIAGGQSRVPVAASVRFSGRASAPKDQLRTSKDGDRVVR
jgi:hypothetical protein